MIRTMGLASIALSALLAGCANQSQKMAAPAPTPQTEHALLPPGTIIRGGSDAAKNGYCRIASGTPRCRTGFEAVVSTDGTATVRFAHGNQAFSELSRNQPFTGTWEEVNRGKKISLVNGKLTIPTDQHRVYHFTCDSHHHCKGHQTFTWPGEPTVYPWAIAVIDPPPASG